MAPAPSRETKAYSKAGADGAIAAGNLKQLGVGLIASSDTVVVNAGALLWLNTPWSLRTLAEWYEFPCDTPKRPGSFVRPSTGEAQANTTTCPFPVRGEA